MDLSPDYEDLFKILNAYKIKYLVAGAYAVMYYSAPRYTKDIDIWVIPEMNDPSRVYRALKEFGAPLKGMSPEDFTNKKLIFQIGIVPVRIDILMDLSVLSFESAWKKRKRTKYGETSIHLLGLSDLIKTKKHAGRLQDQLDLETLLKHSKHKKTK